MKIYHNPSCSKSRATLALLKERGEETIEVVEYLKEPPTLAVLQDLLSRLAMRPREILRDKEAVFLDNYSKLDLNDDQAVLEVLVKHPVLIERPIVVRGDRAVIGRPPENIDRLWK